jgi:hypothetical protein
VYASVSVLFQIFKRYRHKTDEKAEIVNQLVEQVYDFVSSSVASLNLTSNPHFTDKLVVYLDDEFAAFAGSFPLLLQVMQHFARVDTPEGMEMCRMIAKSFRVVNEVCS